jgi:hypothetical protein
MKLSVSENSCEFQQFCPCFGNTLSTGLQDCQRVIAMKWLKKFAAGMLLAVWSDVKSSSGRSLDIVDPEFQMERKGLGSGPDSFWLTADRHQWPLDSQSAATAPGQ